MKTKKARTDRLRARLRESKEFSRSMEAKATPQESLLHLVGAMLECIQRKPGLKHWYGVVLVGLPEGLLGIHGALFSPEELAAMAKACPAFNQMLESTKPTDEERVRLAQRAQREAEREAADAKERGEVVN